MIPRFERFGPWELASVIAVGGMAEVWRARGDSQVAEIALKRIHSHLRRNDDARALFAAEQAIATTLAPHPHVIAARAHGDVDGWPYLALALAPGSDLRVPDALGADAPVGTRVRRARAIALVRAAASAVAHLHAHGVVHGDVCPGNLVVDPATYLPVLVDLGVTRPIGATGPMRGTHAYMAPEQVRGEAWTRALDVFALGVVLWELVRGERLFHRGPPWLTMAAVVDAPVPPLGDAPLDAVLARALAKDVGARLADADALVGELDALAS